MKKKILLIIFIILLIIGSFFVGRQVGLNTEDSKTQTIVKEETVSLHDIKKTLTSSGQVESKTTEKVTLTTTKYFKAMCVEEDDTVSEGENILEYTDGTFLVAPYNCVVISYSVPEAESICTSSNYIEISSLNDLTISISINENEINSVAVDQEVEITLTADESKTYTGKITKIDSVGTYQSSGATFPAIVEFTNDGNVKLGMSVSCTVILKEESQVACVPIDAVSENSEGKEYVVKVNEDGTTEEVIIETGIADDSYVQVLSGINVDDKVQITTEVIESTSTSSLNNERGMMGGSGSGRPGESSNGGMQGGMERGGSDKMPSQGGSQGGPSGKSNQ